MTSYCIIALALCLLAALVVLPAFVRSSQITREQERRTITDDGRAALQAQRTSKEGTK
jgi:hypothetical protein